MLGDQMYMCCVKRRCQAALCDCDGTMQGQIDSPRLVHAIRLFTYSATFYSYFWTTASCNSHMDLQCRIAFKSILFLIKIPIGAIGEFLLYNLA